MSAARWPISTAPRHSTATRLGFSRAGTQSPDPALTALLGARRIDARQLRRGRQVLELMAFDPPGAAYPADSAANDRWMQHCALVTDDMAADYARLEQAAYTPISTAGPQTLPGGIVRLQVS